MSNDIIAWIVFFSIAILIGRKYGIVAGILSVPIMVGSLMVYFFYNFGRKTSYDPSKGFKEEDDDVFQ